MYDELVKRLRAAKAVVFKTEDVTLLGDAADAIEKLSKAREAACWGCKCKKMEPPKEK